MAAALTAGVAVATADDATAQDPPRLTLEVSPPETSENGDASTVTATLDVASTETVTFTLDVYPGQNVTGDDFTRHRAFRSGI